MGTDPLTHETTLVDLLWAIYSSPPRLQSNFVRDHSYEVARLASCGLITTRLGDDFGHHWRITLQGMQVLELTK